MSDANDRRLHATIRAAVKDAAERLGTSEATIEQLARAIVFPVNQAQADLLRQAVHEAKPKP